MTVADEPIRGVALSLPTDARVALLEQRVEELEALLVSVIDQFRHMAAWQTAGIMPAGSIIN
jgi:hypothetical protein